MKGTSASWTLVLCLSVGSCSGGASERARDAPPSSSDEVSDGSDDDVVVADEGGRGGSGLAGSGGHAADDGGAGGARTTGGRGGAASEPGGPERVDAGTGGVRSDAATDLSPLPRGGTWEVDLTKGSAGTRVVEQTGGAWEGGWRVTSARGDRLVWDLGRPIASGFLEVSVTVRKDPHATAGKVNWAGLFELASLNQDEDGDIFYARVGAAKYGFSRPKAAGHRFDMTEWEPSVGSASDWIVDDKTVHTVRFEWKNGGAVFHDAKGRAHTCPRDICGGAAPVDELRYVFVGADKWPRFNTDTPENLSPVGMRFLRLKVVDTAP